MKRREKEKEESRIAQNKGIVGGGKKIKDTYDPRGRGDSKTAGETCEILVEPGGEKEGGGSMYVYLPVG